MIIYTHSRPYAEALLAAACEPPFEPLGRQAEGRAFAEAFFDQPIEGFGAHRVDPYWRVLLASELAFASQYERLIEASRKGLAIPDGLVCAARSGPKFQGFRGRSWVGRPGNVHLAIHLAPNRPIERFETIFMVLAAVALVEAIDGISGLEGAARIKWVNDVLIGDSKVGGVLAYTQTRGMTVTSVVLGIGLNVETSPVITPTPFVPAALALNDVAGAEATTAPDLVWKVLQALARNYRILLTAGYRPLMESYRSRSAVIGRDVALSSDDEDEIPRIFAAGRVHALGDGLELILSGLDEPIRRGRLILADRVDSTGFSVPPMHATLSQSAT